ncbi:winged helix-turn-helix transcriptional regulator [Amycolatopsis sp. NBC_01480]|uniref:winged helix-turn-helix transcriptional regulator n=1 Tax=Amycolatopsis sp. NBC_01480 TaxID=2903562 RepID=UPI002E2A5D4B|nr:helix-turn-helix domain-containing protein [Amycolatopsis sp. NBC_01480]
MTRTAGNAELPAGAVESCSLTQTVEMVGERWKFLILREALGGATRFSEFRDVLGIASDVLSNRLAALVESRILERREYRETGQRARFSYHLTAAGRELALAVAALQQWGDRYRPSDQPALRFFSPDGTPLTVRFVDERGDLVAPSDVRIDNGRSGEPK